MSWYLKVLKKYATFSGRARRREYWLFFLVSILITFVLAIIDVGTGQFDEEVGYGLLSTVYSVAVLLPGIAVSVRRLHDIGRTGWWLLVAFVPLLGALILLVFMLSDGQAGDNPYGPSPKAITA